jgi:hypothetical protein
LGEVAFVPTLLALPGLRLELRAQWMIGARLRLLLRRRL